jgi:hypothetical protein
LRKGHWVAITGLVVFLTLVAALRWGPVHELVLETVLTSGHAAWAEWIASPAEIRQMRARALGDQRAVSGPAKTSRPAVTWGDLLSRLPRPLSEAGVLVVPLVHPGLVGWRGWLVEVRDPRRVHLLVSDRFEEGIGEQLHRMAESAGAEVAWNGGDFYDPMGKGLGRAFGAVVQDGRLLNPPDREYVIGLDGRGKFVFGHYTAAEIRALGIREAVSWVGPALVSGGRPVQLWGDGGWGYGPRTIMGQRADGTLLVVVVDGRQPGWSIGASMVQMRDLMLALGAVNAIALDGGSSSALYVRGHGVDGIVNRPSSPAFERLLPDGFGVVGATSVAVETTPVTVP